MPVSEKSLKNLNPAKKGEVRNPKGKPCKLPELDKLLADVLGEEKDGITAAEAILKALRAKATKGDIRAAEVLFERGYGKSNWSKSPTSNSVASSTHIEVIPAIDFSFSTSSNPANLAFIFYRSNLKKFAKVLFNNSNRLLSGNSRRKGW